MFSSSFTTLISFFFNSFCPGDPQTFKLVAEFLVFTPSVWKLLGTPSFHGLPYYLTHAGICLLNLFLKARPRHSLLTIFADSSSVSSQLWNHKLELEGTLQTSPVL